MHATQKRLIQPYKKVLSLVLFFSFTVNLSITCREGVLISKEELVSLVKEPENDLVYRNLATEEELAHLRTVHHKKPVTLVIYIAADNDLHPFAWKNIKQMETIGSNENINIIVQLNTPGYFNPTKRYIIKNGRRLLIPADGQAPTQKFNSGHPQTLIDCVAWAMKHYPADHLYLNLWDHGAGIYDPGMSRDHHENNTKLIDSLELFNFNEETQELELDRSLGYTINPDMLDQETYQHQNRGICFDDTYKSFLSNQDLKFALYEIQNKILKGKKIDVLWFDACLMAMLEIANICKDHVSYLVASQEVEFASGSNYELVLNPFINKALLPKEFACHIVTSYEKAYQSVTRDYTQSAVDLSIISQLESNTNLIAGQLLIALQNQKNNAVVKLLQQSKSRQSCACFQEPSYIDLRNFYINLQTNLNTITLLNPSTELTVKTMLNRLLDQGINLINSAVIANKVGSNLQKAGGISIYFPERGIFNSYPKCLFAQTNNWGTMLAQYLLAKK